MFNIFKKIIQYPRVTMNYPEAPFDARYFEGAPVVRESGCNQCGECVRRCPSGAVVLEPGQNQPQIDLGRCLFCTLCGEVCPTGAIEISHQFELAAKNREALRIGLTPVVRDDPDGSAEAMAREVQAKARRLFGRSLQIREVDAGSCNGCDYEVNALNNPFNDLERFGFHFVASPRHADMLLVTGPAARNMQEALVKTYEATPDPKLVVAVGACACSGGIFRDSYAALEGISSLIPVDVYVPGCPPRPQAIIYGILKALDRV